MANCKMKSMKALSKEKDIQKGFKVAKTITKNWAKTFYFASRLLSPEKRKAAYSIYAICRLSDDAVDNPANPSALEQINKIKKNIDAVYNDKTLESYVLLAFKHTVNKYDIPKRYFDELIEGMYMDLEKKRYEDFNQLYLYCYRVAGVVGLIMLKIFGYNNSSAQQHAIDLGIAMQLTNILRDIKEDFGRGRIYLPLDEMTHFGILENHLQKAEVDDRFIAFLKFQIERTRKYYERSLKGINMISSVRSRLVVCTMKDLYAAILKAIENNGYDVFSRRAHINTLAKFGHTLNLFFKGEYLCSYKGNTAS